jgi:predicted dehydrogenase
MTLRGALIGCGQVSQHHLRGWSQIDGVEIVALYNRTVSKAEDRARQFNISLDHVYSDYNEMLDKEDVDFVDIATAPDVHREHVEAVAARSIDVFCQKPFAPTIDDAHAMIAACDTAGVLLSINENWRWRSWYRDLKKILDSGVLGKIRYVSVMKHRSITLPGLDMSPPPLAAEPHAMKHDRLIVYDWGIHLIDLLRFLFGDVSSIYALMDHVSSYCKGEDRALMTLNIDQIMAVIDISWASILAQPDTMNLDTRPENIIIEGDKGTIELPEYGNVIRVTTESTTSEQPAYEGTPLEAYQASYTAAQRHFMECLRSGQLPETEARDNLKTLMATFAAYESAAKNQVINLKYNP